MDCLLLRLDAPLMSFGGVLVDQINPTDRFPGASLLTGLLGNALGWDHRDTERLDDLQARLRHASRWDAEPVRIVDYQTVNLGQDALQGTGWTTRGIREDRGSGAATSGTHQRYRHYWADGCATVALHLEGPGALSLSDLESALAKPARPLFIGRKPCLPATPILLGRRSADTVRAALIAEPLADIGPRRRPDRIEACWPANDSDDEQASQHYDQRSWRNNMHIGSRCYAVGFLEIAR